MISFLFCLSAAGEILDQMQLDPDLRLSSIRHLALRGDGLVGFAMQGQGDDSAGAPLVGLYRPGAAPNLMRAPLAENRLMQGYAGSITFDA